MLSQTFQDCFKTLQMQTRRTPYFQSLTQRSELILPGVQQSLDRMKQSFLFNGLV